MEKEWIKEGVEEGTGRKGEEEGIGVYVHVPFCRSKCFYCGFYSVAAMGWREVYRRAVVREIGERGGWAGSRRARTLYVGGGTPSCLTREELEEVVGTLEGAFAFEEGAERTIEANPEDLTRERLRDFRELGFNRLSVGVQSFADERLKGINRRHTGRQAEEGVRRAAEAGFEDVGVDLMLGLPGQTAEEVRRDLETVAGLPVTHLSVYMLSVDPGTVLEKMAERGAFVPEGEEVMAERYREVCRWAREAGFEHYEISNFARGGRYSRHNTGYWEGRRYVGFGPAAHSYDGRRRVWNAGNVKRYAEAVERGERWWEGEVLGERELYDEFIMTGLRTTWGIDEGVAARRWGQWWEEARKRVEDYAGRGLLERAGGRLRMTEEGWLVADMVMADLFAGEEG